MLLYRKVNNDNVIPNVIKFANCMNDIFFVNPYNDHSAHLMPSKYSKVVLICGHDPAPIWQYAKNIDDSNIATVSEKVLANAFNMIPRKIISSIIPMINAHMSIFNDATMCCDNMTSLLLNKYMYDNE